MASLKDKIFKAFNFKAYNFDSSISTLAGIFYDLVRMYSIDIKSFVLEHSSPQSAILFLKEIINALRVDAGNFDFENDNLQLMVIELGINIENYLDSIYKLKPTDHPFSKFIFEVHRDNYLEKYNAKYIFDYLNLSEVYNGKLKRKDWKQLSQLLESETNLQEAVSRSIYKETTIQNLIDYVHIKTYLSTLDKLDNIIDNSLISDIFKSQPKNLQKDKTQLEGYHLAFLFYLYLRQFGIDSLKNPHHLFASYFYQMLYGELLELSKQIANDLSMDERDKENTYNFLKSINSVTPLSSESSPFLKKYFDKIEGQSLSDIVNLPERKNKILEESFASEIRWSKIKRSSSCAFNLAKKEGQNWTFQSNKFDLFISILKRTYPTLMTDQIINQSNLFKAECLNFYT